MYGRKRNDKIFDNNYNQGITDEIYNEPITVDTEYKNTYLENENRAFDMYRLKELSESMLELIANSEEFKHFIKDKSKNLKNRIQEVSFFVLKNYDGTDYSFSEKFSCLCDVLKIKEELVYAELPVVYKDQAINEIFEIYPSLKEKNNKLF